MRYFLAIILFLCISQLWASEIQPGLVLEKAPIKPGDIHSIKRGAKFFATNCISCHTMVYLRYNTIAKEAGITYEKMPINVKEWPYGIKPPDLSLEADVRGVNWIYTYLHSFYQDSSRPTGVNNLIMPDTAMPNMVGPYQGEQVRVETPMPDLLHQYQWYDLVKLTKQGSMTPEAFDATITDLVNFLGYAAAPYQIEQHQIGFWVIAFLAVLFFLMYLLKREYWRDVKKHKRHIAARSSFRTEGEGPRPTPHEIPH